MVENGNNFHQQLIFFWTRKAPVKDQPVHLLVSSNILCLNVTEYKQKYLMERAKKKYDEA